jgi:hypothetical protein
VCSSDLEGTHEEDTADSVVFIDDDISTNPNFSVDGTKLTTRAAINTLVNIGRFLFGSSFISGGVGVRNISDTTFRTVRNNYSGRSTGFSGSWLAAVIGENRKVDTIFYLQAMSQDGDETVSAKIAASFKRVGSATAVRVGAIEVLWENETSSGTPTYDITIGGTNQVNVVFNSGQTDKTYEWTWWADWFELPLS